LLIDKNVTISNLKGVLTYFAHEFFGPDREIRLRPYHFRFTEPSFEIDVTCGLCGGKGCKYCKGGWAELGGAGMVHPKVLRNGGINPQEYSGFAFGWGVERTYLMRSGVNIPDIRMVYKNDVRFLEQF
jgi:phenylalanyl-tRNA synthetase alpha chain